MELVTPLACTAVLGVGSMMAFSTTIKTFWDLCATRCLGQLAFTNRSPSSNLVNFRRAQFQSSLGFRYGEMTGMKRLNCAWVGVIQKSVCSWEITWRALLGSTLSGLGLMSALKYLFSSSTLKIVQCIQHLQMSARQISFSQQFQ